MIKYGIKLWSNNEEYFKEAVIFYREKKIDFLELKNNYPHKLDYGKLKILREIPIFIHTFEKEGFNKFVLDKKDIKNWNSTIQLANFFDSKFIIVHPGVDYGFNSFLENLKKIDDYRILIENMPGLDLDNQIMYGQTVKQLKKIRKICFDFEKAIKAANYQNIDYKKFIENCLTMLKPFYFHISGCDINTPYDQHLNLWESNIDLKYIKKKLDKLSSIRKNWICFETPKKNSLDNDIKNIEYFKRI